MQHADYLAALKRGKKEYVQSLQQRKTGHPIVLQELIHYEKLTQVDLGVMEIPIEQIVGTLTSLRTQSFSPSFFPLAEEKSEFADKWLSLLQAQTEEGMREPILVFEYLHRFYIREGNKRVSIMRYLQMPSIEAHVVRLLPMGKQDLYDEFVAFFSSARMYDFDFTVIGSYQRLLRVLGMRLEGVWPSDYVNFLKGAFFRFSRIYKQNPDYHLTVSDAFLHYLEIYRTDSLLDYDAKVIAERMEGLYKKLEDTKKQVWKILVLSDEEDPGLWEYWSADKTRDIDLILSAGDLKAEYLEFIATMTGKPVLYVRGNHDTHYDIKEPLGCIHIDDDVYVFRNALRICGLGGSMRYREGKDMFSEKEMKKRIRKLRWKLYKQRGVDIFLTHTPPLGHGDLEDLPHLGFACFNEFLEKYRPKYMIYGHIHKTYSDFNRVRVHPCGTYLINAFGKYILEIEKE